jgi:hypothetical protein
MKWLPPAPQWDRTIDGLEDGFKWAQDYERSFLPPDIVFPESGEIWEAVRRCEVNFVAFIPKTILPAGKAWLEPGEQVRVLTDKPKPVHINFQPVRYDELHLSIVPEEIRNRPGYLYYWLSLRIAHTPCCIHKETGFFSELFRPVQAMG